MSDFVFCESVTKACETKSAVLFVSCPTCASSRLHFHARRRPPIPALQPASESKVRFTQNDLTNFVVTFCSLFLLLFFLIIFFLFFYFLSSIALRVAQRAHPPTM